jgi:hypothetical protein
VRVLADPEGRDRLYIQLADAWEPSPDGFSVMLLPSTNDGIPTRVDLYFDGEGRLKALRVEEPARYLKPEINKAAEPFPHLD